MITAYPEVVIESLGDDCDFMILACDGVWDCKTNQEACDFVTERLKKNPNMKLSKIIEELLDEILATDIYTGKLLPHFINIYSSLFTIETGVGCDNMTCIIVQFKKGSKK